MAVAIGEAPQLVLQLLVVQAETDAPGASTVLIASTTGLSARQVSDAAAKLILAGWAERPAGPGFYRATEAGRTALASGATITSGPKAPTGAPRRLRDTFRTRAWKSMRIRKQFTPTEVAMDAARDEREPVEDAYRYIRHLEKGGYVVAVVAPGSKRLRLKGTTQRYRLVKDTGPVAPVWSQVRGCVQDFNIRAGNPLEPKR